MTVETPLSDGKTARIGNMAGLQEANKTDIPSGNRGQISAPEKEKHLPERSGACKD